MILALASCLPICPSYSRVFREGPSPTWKPSMDVMLMSQCPDRATFQVPQDPTVCVPLNRGPLLPCLPSRCMLSFREPGEESPSCLHCRCVPVLRNRLTAVPAWTESVPAARPALACNTRPCVMPQRRCIWLLLQATPRAGLCGTGLSVDPLFPPWPQAHGKEQEPPALH